MTTEEKYILIEKHLDKSLSEEEQVIFDKLMLDPEFKKEIALHQGIESTLEDDQLLKVQAAIDQANRTWQQPTQQLSEAKITPLKSIYKFIGAVAAVGLIFFAYFLISKTSSPDQLYSQHFRNHPIVMSQRSGDNEITVQNAINQYQAENFEEAAKLFEFARQANPNQLAYSFYEAISKMNNGAFQEAISLLKPLTQRPKHVFSDASLWYLGLAHLKLGNSKESISALQNINSASPYFNESSALLKKLK
ncbi:MAG: tetratricopeptide repeat protein [Bacteroidota bacterium]